MNHSQSLRCAWHLRHALNPVTALEVVDKIYKHLVRKKKHFDGIAVRGLSGLLVGAPVAHRLKVPLCVIRKGEDCHSCHQVEGSTSVLRYIVIDDLVDSGSTINTIIEKMKNFNQGSLVGLILYSDEGCMSNTRREYLETQWDCWIKSIM